MQTTITIEEIRATMTVEAVTTKASTIWRATVDGVNGRTYDLELWQYADGGLAVITSIHTTHGRMIMDEYTHLDAFDRLNTLEAGWFLHNVHCRITGKQS